MILFLSICGSTFQNVAARTISTALPHVPMEQITQLITGTSSQAYKALGDEDRRAVILEITNALLNVWLMYAVAAALSFVCSLPLWVRFFGHFNLS